MFDEIKIGIIGGDKRLCAVADAAAADGFECAVWGTSGCTSGVRCAEVEDTMRASAAVILPLPLSQDGVRLFAPGSAEGSALRLTKLAELLPTETRVFAGRIPCEFQCLLKNRGISATDYYENEALKIKNAYQTAEGAVGIAISELLVTLSGCRALVVGYGRVGRATAGLLGRMGARVTVAARRESDLASAVCEGFSIFDDAHGLEGVPGRFEVIFNTVPVRLLTPPVLAGFSGALMVDLASVPFGAGEEECDAAGVRLVRAVSLPGRTSPVSAGLSIYETVRDALKREGVI